MTIMASSQTSMSDRSYVSNNGFGANNTTIDTSYTNSGDKNGTNKNDGCDSIKLPHKNL